MSEALTSFTNSTVVELGQKFYTPKEFCIGHRVHRIQATTELIYRAPQDHEFYF